MKKKKLKEVLVSQNEIVTSPLVGYSIKTQGLPEKRSVKC